MERVRRFRQINDFNHLAGQQSLKIFLINWLIVIPWIIIVFRLLNINIHTPIRAMKRPLSVLCLLLLAYLAQAQQGINQLSDQVKENTSGTCSGHYADLRIDFDICDPFTVSFTNLTAGASAVFWDFGDGTNTSSSGNTSHKYVNEGVYRVQMITQTKTGCYDTVYKKFLMNVDSGTIFTEREIIVFSLFATLPEREAISFVF